MVFTRMRFGVLDGGFVASEVAQFTSPQPPVGEVIDNGFYSCYNVIDNGIDNGIDNIKVQRNIDQ
jgi:hypothetical protein